MTEAASPRAANSGGSDNPISHLSHLAGPSTPDPVDPDDFTETDRLLAMSDVETAKRRYSSSDERLPLEPEERSYGVLKSEAAARFMNQSFRYAIFAGIALAAYAVSLDQVRDQSTGCR